MKRTTGSDSRAVSPVIGVILMVAITVILAAVIATFVLGLGESLSTKSPQASFSFTYDSGQLTVTHTSGPAITADQLTINGTSWVSAAGIPAESKVGAGDSATISAPADATVRVVWSSDTGDSSAILATWNGANS